MSPVRIDDKNTTTIAPARVVREDALLIFGLGQRYRTNAGIPLQWDRFMPYLGTIRNQMGKETYGVICNPDDTGSYEYITGVRVSGFPEKPAEFSRLRIAPQTYAIFEHKDHVASVGTTWRAVWDHAIADAGYRALDGAAFERYGEQFDGRTGLGGFELWVPIASR